MDINPPSCGDELPTLIGRACCSGLDLSSTADITFLALAFQAGSQALQLRIFWAMLDGIHECARRHRVPHDGWQRGAYFETAEGVDFAHDMIRRRIGGLAEKHQAEVIAIARCNATRFPCDGTDMTAFVIDQDCNPVQRRMAQDASATQGPIGSPEPDKTRGTGASTTPSRR
jgi:hypothetical protein